MATRFDPVALGFQDLSDPGRAPELATLLVEKLRVDDVVFDVRDTRIITTAFGNLLFATVLSELPIADVRARLRFRTANATQREVIRRSLRVARQNLNS